jgi:hypothetical protein
MRLESHRRQQRHTPLDCAFSTASWLSPLPIDHITDYRYLLNNSSIPVTDTPLKPHTFELREQLVEIDFLSYRQQLLQQL